MVRWVKKSPASPGAGTAPSTQPASALYDYDFSILDKYLDAAEKNLGKPSS